MRTRGQGLVLCVDEKPNTSVDRTRRAAVEERPVRYDDARLQAQRHHTLFAALNVLDGTVIGEFPVASASGVAEVLRRFDA